MTQETSSQPPPQQPSGEPDELLVLIKALCLLWKKKWWIVLGTALFTGGGIAYALHAEPVYTSGAIIATRETSSNVGVAGVLSQMGDMGGMLAAQMGAGTTLERIAVIATSHDLAEAVISRYNLLPYLFHKQYDFKNSCWKIKDPRKIPSIKLGAKNLKQSVLSVSTDVRKKVFTLKVSFYDSVLAAKVVNYYLDEIDNKIRNDVIREAKDRRAYLDAQMKSTADPWVMQKLQALAGMEMEKSMMVAGSSFQVLETPMVPLKKTKPHRSLLVIEAFFLGIFLSGSVVLGLDYVKSIKARYAALESENAFRKILPPVK